MIETFAHFAPVPGVGHGMRDLVDAERPEVDPGVTTRLAAFLATVR